MKKTISKAKYGLLSAILSVGGLLVLVAPAAHAATNTWTGAAAGPCDWSVAGNWSGGVPVNGDDLVFDQSVVNVCTGESTNDIPSGTLSTVNSVQFSNDPSGLTYSVHLTSLTITSAITQQPTVTKTTILKGDITLGGNVTVTNTGSLMIGNTVPSTSALALNSNTLTFVETGSQSGILAVISNITGAGTVVYDAPNTSFQLQGANTYSGVTNVLANQFWVGTTTDNNAFGTSTINVSENGAIRLVAGAGSTTISNPIVFAGVPSGSPVVTSLDIKCVSGGCTPGAVLTLPNITLNGNISASNAEANLSVDLAGITANGHCVQYLTNGSSLDAGFPAPGFVNGPAFCVIAVGNSTSPNAPNTGAALVLNNPIVSIVVTLIAAAGLGFIAKRQFATKK